ncbi:Hypothetical predicted protein [Paramuricea clavata]|uniref:Uncharacterized protein n=1 Tax=Paramuricea clavata TaxID=317549 RepID=A0A6S7ITZ1_PARCT|nr:Hypothetical predicted protein [Paramuricea clavata]
MNRKAELMPDFRRMNKAEITGDRTRHVLTLNPNSAKHGEEIYVNSPKLKAGSVFVPDSMALVFDFKNSNTKSWFKNNLGKLLQRRLEICLAGEKVYDNSGESLLEVYKDLWLHKKQRDDMMEDGIASEATRKKNIQRRCTKRRCGCHRIVRSIRNKTKNPNRKVESQYNVGRKLPFEHVIFMKKTEWSMDSIIINETINVPRRSMKAIVMLFTNKTRTDSEEYVYPNIEKVRVTVEGKVKETEKVQCAILLHLIGDEALEVYNTFTFGEGEDRDKLSVLKKKFEDYVNCRKNTVFERYKFWECKQQEGETIDQFITELKTRAKSCEFGDQTDSMIRDRILFGVSDIRLKERLLRESSELTLEKAASLCRAAEESAKQLKELRKQNVDPSKPEVHVVKKPTRDVELSMQ